MSTLPVLTKIMSDPNNVWQIVSNHSNPETWIPFLDSRRLENCLLKDNEYFPTNLAHVCMSPIQFNSLECSSLDRTVKFSLSFEGLTFCIQVKIAELNEGTVLEVDAHAEFDINRFEGGREILFYICSELARNIELLVRIQFPMKSSALVQEQTADIENKKKLKLEKLEASSIKRVSVLEGLDSALKLKQPVIFSDYGKSVESYNQMSEFSWWLSKFGSQTFSFHIFKGAAYDKETEVGRTTLGVLIDAIESNVNRLAFSVYQIHDFGVIGLNKFLRYPEIIGKDNLVVRSNLWVGSKGVKSPLHQDGMETDITGCSPAKLHNLNFQIIGEKEVFLAHPNQTNCLYAKRANLMKPRFAESELDVFKEIDYSKYPMFRDVKCFKGKLKPGELLYVPRGWWHAFNAESNSVNYNTFFSSNIV